MLGKPSTLQESGTAFIVQTAMLLETAVVVTRPVRYTLLKAVGLTMDVMASHGNLYRVSTAPVSVLATRHDGATPAPSRLLPQAHNTSFTGATTLKAVLLPISAAHSPGTNALEGAADGSRVA